MNEQTATTPVSLASLMTPSKTVTIDYPDMEGFSVDLTYLAREELLKESEKNEENILKKKGSNQEANFYNTWDDETQMFVDALSRVIKYSGLQEVEIETNSIP